MTLFLITQIIRPTMTLMLSLLCFMIFREVLMRGLLLNLEMFCVMGVNAEFTR